MLVGSPVTAKTDCPAMSTIGAHMSHACCNGENACCKNIKNGSSSLVTSCTCAQNSQPLAALANLSLRLSSEEFSKIVVAIASLFFACLAKKLCMTDAAAAVQWRPPKIELYLFYRVLRI